MKRLKGWMPALGIFVLALAVRVIYNNTVAHNYTPLHDSLFYQTIGLNLLREHCFCLHPYIATVYRAPLWPFLIAGLSVIFGPGDYAARIFLSIVGSGTCVLVYLFARDLFGKSLGLLAGVIAAIYPELYIYDGWLYTESLYIFLSFALCYTLYRIQRVRGEKTWLWVISGIVLGLLSLTRPNGLLLLALVIAWAIVLLWFKLLARSATLRGILMAVFIALALVTPWTVRNYLVSHAFIPVATGDGTVLLGAYNDQVLISPPPQGTWINPNLSVPGVALKFPLYTCDPPCEVQREDVFKNAAIQWIRGHLSIMPHLLALHFLNIWQQYTPSAKGTGPLASFFQPAPYEADLPVDRFPNQESSKLVLAMMQTFPIPIFILAGIALLLTLYRWRELLFLYGSIALTIALSLYFYGIPRFRAPIEPMLILLAVGALWWLVSPEKGAMRWLFAQFQPPRQSAHAERSEEPSQTVL